MHLPGEKTVDCVFCVVTHADIPNARAAQFHTPNIAYQYKLPTI